MSPHSAAEATSSAVLLLPRDDATLFYADVSVIRNSGLLSKLVPDSMGEESDYRDFVALTHFNYARDLDQVAVASEGEETYFVADGRFDWKRLREYVAQRGGACNHDDCWAPTSKPNRYASFRELTPARMALTVSMNKEATAQWLQKAGRLKIAKQPSDLPAAPAWILLPKAALKQVASYPPIVQPMLQLLRGGEETLVAIESDKNQPEEIKISLATTCDSLQSARQVLGNLNQFTNLVKSAVVKQNDKQNQAELVNVLASGTFKQQGQTVKGNWPLSRRFIDSLIN